MLFPCFDHSAAKSHMLPLPLLSLKPLRLTVPCLFAFHDSDISEKSRSASEEEKSHALGACHCAENAFQVNQMGRVECHWGGRLEGTFFFFLIFFNSSGSIGNKTQDLKHARHVRKRFYTELQSQPWGEGCSKRQSVGTEGVAQLAECLPTRHEALGSSPCTT